MPEIKIKSEVAGRVCSIAAAVGASLSDGDEIAFVEAMKMEIPVSATASGTVKSILVAVDDIVAEGQVIAVIEGV
jgi:acetyl-CoA carboxylase biotin carboxyl carrier protein